MYFKTIREFLKDISFLETSFIEWCGKDLNKITAENQNEETTCYLEKMVDKYNETAKKISTSIIWLLIKYTYYSVETPDEKIAKDIDNIKMKRKHCKGKHI